MHKEQYIKIREAGRILSEKIFPEGAKNKIEYAAKKLDLWSNERKTLMFDDESDMEAFAEYLIYQPDKKGTTVLDNFYESDIELSDFEEDYLEGMVDSYASLFAIQEVDADNATLILKDELDKDAKVYSLMDINLSQTAKPDILIYTRLLPIEDVFISSGLSFIYHPQYKTNMMNHISSLRFRKRRKLTSSDLFILCYKKNNEYGMAMETTTSYE